MTDDTGELDETEFSRLVLPETRVSERPDLSNEIVRYRRARHLGRERVLIDCPKTGLHPRNVA